MIGYPKPEKGNKRKNKSRSSDGSEYTQSMIEARLRQAYLESNDKGICECCHREQGVDHDHTIAKARCKEIGKTELIWNSDNWSWSCRDCHGQWESYKSGEFQKHHNVITRMRFMKKHDLEKFQSRMNYITDIGIKLRLE